MSDIKFDPALVPLKKLSKFFGQRYGQRNVDRIFSDLGLLDIPEGNKKEKIEKVLQWSISSNQDMVPVILQELINNHHLDEKAIEELMEILKSFNYYIDKNNEIKKITSSSDEKDNKNIYISSKNVKQIDSSQLFIKKKVFISHSSSDKVFVEKLIDQLDKKGIEIWYDKWEIKVGDSITEKINEGLKSSDYLVVILSKNSVKSRWVKEELNSAMIKNIESKKAFILPVLIEDCAIPELLSHRKYADFRYDFNMGIEELLNSIE